ncbi:anti-sigma factor [Georgenia sp. H159]|uniref:anti-sigma factor n=1 Tax=Georgenia sp. H159 TaxID=3076115 RepID=UPI002D7960FD|nr:anti-sigma factor [Georgenia sp. H159]
MRHLDDETLTLVALGEQQPQDAAAEHLRTCEQCSAELAGLAAVVTAGRAGGRLEAPPAHVWDRIAAEIAAEDGPADAPRVSAGGRRAGDRRPGPSTRPAGRRDGGRRRSALSRAAWLAAGLAAGVAGTLVVTQLPDGPTGPATVAEADLEPLPGWSETGAARVEEAGDRRLLHVEVTGEVSDGIREVWLLDEAAQQLVSVGLLVGTEGTFDLPEAIDLEELVLVDISREPLDGDPAHSGDSIVRGRLTT